MADIKTVMSWVEGLTQDDWRWNYSDSEVQETAKAALALLKAQEPRVLTLEEVLVGDECWFEYINGSRGYADVYVQDNRTAIIYRTTTRPVEVPLTDYMKKWRCWSYRPTEEQRKEAKWDDACQAGRNSSADSAGGKAP